MFPGKAHSAVARKYREVFPFPSWIQIPTQRRCLSCLSPSFHLSWSSLAAPVCFDLGGVGGVEGAGMGPTQLCHLLGARLPRCPAAVFSLETASFDCCY